jgi:hypothetical protein
VSRRSQRVAYLLDPGDVATLSAAEIAAILRGADSMIGSGGRTQLSKLLKGSREASVLDHRLDLNPSFGFFRPLSLQEILHRVDWVIERSYLKIEYSGRLPVLFFTPAGWAIEAVTMADELLRGFDARLAAGPPYDLSDLKDRNRGMIFLLLDRIEASGRGDFLPLLTAWYEIDYAKVRARIEKTAQQLAAGSGARESLAPLVPSSSET